jgi:hypothetical protein
VVDEEKVGREVLAERRGVELDEALSVRQSQILEKGGLEILVAVEDENGQGDVNPGSNDLDALEAFVPVGVRVLAEDDDLVSEPAPGLRERARVDIRSGPTEEVAVPEENLHAWMILTDLS